MMDQSKIIKRLKSDVIFHARTLWLFTRSEHKTIVYPWVVFGIFGATSGSAVTTNPEPDVRSIMARAPHTLVWMWLVILVFTVANQRAEESVIEDSINKPWRPIPSKRLTTSQARCLLLGTVPVVYLVSLHLNVHNQALVGMVLTWMYNDLRGSDENYIVRNIINALGLTTWSIGAIRVACGLGGHTLNEQGYRWLLFVGLIICTTLQLQDFRDQEGDLKKGRKTLQLVWNDQSARCLTSAFIVVWSLLSPAWWALDFVYYLGPGAIGVLIASRLLLWRDAISDERTWKLWGVWMASLFMLPLCKNCAVQVL